MFKGMNAIEFNKRFSNNEDCYAYLFRIKWGKGYQCARCGGQEYTKGKTMYYYRCKSCRYDESITANTMFHGMKMPVLKAFHLILRLTAKKKGMSTVELGNEVGVQQKTAWLFKRKLQSVMKDSIRLKGEVEADEMLIGGYCEGKQNRGRSLKEKRAVVIAIEKVNGEQTGNINFAIVESFASDTLKYALKNMIDVEAAIRTDQHRSYEALKKELLITTVPSQKGKGLPQVHKQIMLFKNWLRGIHHKCSKHHLHAYLDEYKYRFNKRNMRKWIFNDMITRFMNCDSSPFTPLKTVCNYST